MFHTNFEIKPEYVQIWNNNGSKKRKVLAAMFYRHA